MRKIRWGIAGPGNIAAKFAKAVKNVEDAQLVAVASRSEERARKFADEYGITNIFTCYEDMAKSDMVDAVYIATPHTAHKPCAELFLNAKKHVLCEKPVCVNADEAITLSECAQKNGVFLMEAMWTRFLPAIDEAAKVAQSGEIGEIRGVKADFCYSCPPEEDPKLYKNDMAGGSLLDVGIYGLNFAAIFLGDNPEGVTSFCDVANGVDLQTNILLKYKDGSMASVSSAINVVKPSTGYVYGTKGYIEVPDFYKAKEFFVCVDEKTRHVFKPSLGDGFEEEIYEVCNCIKAGKNQSNIMPMSESIRIMKQMDEIRLQNSLKYPVDDITIH